MLKVERLTKRYARAGNNALDDVSFAIPEGSLAALLGPNGAGKSTLINILSGAVTPDSGRVLIGGDDISSGDKRIMSRIGVVPQETAFDYVFTAEEILSLEFGYFGLRKDVRWMAWLLERLSLESKSRVPVRALSGGMKRRLMIAKALIHRPRFLILDEPTAGVDPRLRSDLQEFLGELSLEGMTILLTTHQLEDAERLCGQIIVLDHGKLIANAARKDFLLMAGDYLTAEIDTGERARIKSIFLDNGGFSPDGSADGLKLTFPRHERERVLRAMTIASPYIDSFRINKPNLEDVFTAITTR